MEINKYAALFLASIQLSFLSFASQTFARNGSFVLARSLYLLEASPLDGQAYNEKAIERENRKKSRKNHKLNCDIAYAETPISILNEKDPKQIKIKINVGPCKGSKAFVSINDIKFVNK